MSSGVPIRLRGLRARISSPNFFRLYSIILLSNGPGQTALTVMSSAASRRARARVRWIIPALLALYG